MTSYFSKGFLLRIVLTIPAVLISFSVHEYAHAYTADRLGDKTPRFQGRLTLNPFVHIDIIGFLLFLFIGFGWAKPIETNPSSYKHYYSDDLKVSIAGPLSNFVTSIVFTFILFIFNKSAYSFYSSSIIVNIIENIIIYTIQMNVILFIFNLIPLPGLDGFHVVKDIFPRFFYENADKIYRYQYIILFIFIIPFWQGNSIASYIVGIPAVSLTKLLLMISSI